MNKLIKCADEGLRASVDRLLAFSNSVGRALEDMPAGALRPGDVLGDRFRIVKELGTGGISTVYLAEDRQLRNVALKTLRPELRNDPRAVERFTNEIRMARSIRHPNVCQVFDRFTFDLPSGPLAAAMMQYVPGETLASRISRASIPAAEAVAIATGVAAGIDALHHEGIVHRDLKPGNVILRPAGPDVNPVIIDFGIASRTPRSGATRGWDTQVPGIAGSPDYMAPEQFRGSCVTQAADIYAFGLILFEMAAGQRPFPAEDLLPSAIRRATEDAPDLLAIAPWAPRAWAGPIARALARDPSRRPTSAMEMVHEMQSGSSTSERFSIHVSRRCWHRRRRYPDRLDSSLTGYLPDR